MTTNRTTFFVLRSAAPYATHAPREFAHRRGHWSREALERLAARHGMVLEGAYSIARDSKGWIPASRRDIVESAALAQAE